MKFLQNIWMVFWTCVLDSCAIMMPNFKSSKMRFLALWTEVLNTWTELWYLIGLMKRIETRHTPSKDIFTFIGNFVECQKSKWSRRLCVDIVFTLGLHSNQGEESMWITKVIRILWLHKNLGIKDTCIVRCLFGFKFFHKPYQVLELIPCTEYLSSESQKSLFWKLKIKHNNFAEIKYICLKYYLKKLEEFH